MKLPRVRTKSPSARRTEVLRAGWDGTSAAKLAAKCGVSIVYIYMIKR